MSRTVRISALALVLSLGFTASARADFIDMWADKTDVPADKIPPRGHSKLLVIPVQIDYSGVSGTYGALDTAGLSTFFTAAPSQGTFNFQGYLKVASNSRYSADVTLAPLVEYTGCPPTLTTDSTCVIPSGDITSLTSDMDFIRDVFSRAHAGGVNFSNFDVNGVYANADGGTSDGTIDGVMIVVNVPGVAVTLPISYINGGSNLNGGNGGALVLDGIKIPYVAIGGTVTFADTTVHAERIITEQFGQELGLTTLGYRHPATNDPYAQWQGLHFSTQGDWDYATGTVLPDAESRRALTWQDQHVISGTETIENLQPAANGGYAVKLGMMTSTRQEYYLAEVRGPVGGYDTQIADSSGAQTWGLAVYHIDWSVGPKASSGMFVNHLVNCLDCTPWHPFIGNVEAGGTHFGLVNFGPADLAAFKNTGVADDKVLFQTGAVSFAPVTNAGTLTQQNQYFGSNYYDGTDSGIHISNVIVNADHTVTATFTAPQVSDPCADVTCPPLMVCQTTGTNAGSCVDMTLPVADGGPTNPNDAGPVITPPSSGDSGCATSGSETSSAALWLIPLALLIAAAFRRRHA